jgi:hypothetical protein
MSRIGRSHDFDRSYRQCGRAHHNMHRQSSRLHGRPVLGANQYVRQYFWDRFCDRYSTRYSYHDLIRVLTHSKSGVHINLLLQTQPTPSWRTLDVIHCDYTLRAAHWQLTRWM